MPGLFFTFSVCFRLAIHSVFWSFGLARLFGTLEVNEGMTRE